MKIAVFTPSCRPGFDVTWASLLRQNVDAEIRWIFCDQHFDDRWSAVQSFATQVPSNFSVEHFYLSKREGCVRNLARSYNHGINRAREWGADLFVSLQDYIYVPGDGLQKFVDMYKWIEKMGEDIALYTGLCSISNDPPDDQVWDLGGAFTIFHQPYFDMPKDIGWQDVRTDYSGLRFTLTNPIEYETNWACIPRIALYDERLYFDESYDEAVAYENQDYAYRAQSLGYKILLDQENEVISLPHKRYFPDEWNFEQPLTEVNRIKTEAKWPCDG